MLPAPSSTHFAWLLGVGFAVLLAILNALWGDNEAARQAPEATGGDDHA